MARARTFLGRHWRGQLPLPLAVFAVLLALHGLAVWLVSLWNPHLVGSIAATIMALLGLGLWQVVGTFRTLDRSIAARRNMAMITAGYGAIGLVMVSTVVQGVDLVLANGPPPLVSAAAANGVALSEDGRVLAVEGDITLRGFTALEKALADHPGIQTVRLRSDGGNISAARGMVRLIEATGLETQVSGSVLFGLHPCFHGRGAARAAAWWGVGVPSLLDEPLRQIRRGGIHKPCRGTG